MEDPLGSNQLEQELQVVYCKWGQTDCQCLGLSAVPKFVSCAEILSAAHRQIVKKKKPAWPSPAYSVTKHMETFNISCWVNPRCHLTHTSVKFQKGTSHLKQVWKLPTHLTWIFKVLSGFYSVKILTNICQAECMTQILNVVLAFLVRSIVPEHCTIFILFQSWNTAIVLYATALRQLLPLKQIYPALIPGFTHSKEYKQLQGEARSPRCNPHRSLAIAAGTGTARICRHTRCHNASEWDISPLLLIMPLPIVAPETPR